MRRGHTVCHSFVAGLGVHAFATLVVVFVLVACLLVTVTHPSFYAAVSGEGVVIPLFFWKLFTFLLAPVATERLLDSLPAPLAAPEPSLVCVALVAVVWFWVWLSLLPIALLVWLLQAVVFAALGAVVDSLTA